MPAVCVSWQCTLCLQLPACSRPWLLPHCLLPAAPLVTLPPCSPLAGKLSELAVLALYLMYEKKVGKQSFWRTYIKELDRQRARGVQAVESPLLWSDEELAALLQGSPVVAAVRERLAGIRKEYDELDTVWFMAGSLFNK